MVRKCEVTSCDNPKDNAISMHYGAHAICGTCLGKATAIYIHLAKQEQYYGKFLQDLEKEISET